MISSTSQPTTSVSIGSIIRTLFSEYQMTSFYSIVGTPLFSNTTPTEALYWQWSEGTRLLWGDNTPIRIN